MVAFFVGIVVKKTGNISWINESFNILQSFK